MNYLLSTASLYLHSFASTCTLARQAGFDGLEVSLTPAVAWVGPETLHRRAQEQGLLLSSLHPPTIPLPGWGWTTASLRRLAGLARCLPDCRIVVLHLPAAQSESDPAMERFRRRLQALQQALSGSGIRVALENRNLQPGSPPGPLDDPAALLSFAQAHDCAIVLDTAHAETLPWSLVEVYGAVRERLHNIHLSDATPAGWWGRFSYPRSIFSHHRPPGQGLLPLADLLQALARERYSGLITLELSPAALHIWKRSEPLSILRRSLHWCKEIL